MSSAAAAGRRYQEPYEQQYYAAPTPPHAEPAASARSHSHQQYAAESDAFAQEAVYEHDAQHHTESTSAQVPTAGSSTYPADNSHKASAAYPMTTPQSTRSTSGPPIQPPPRTSSSNAQKSPSGHADSPSRSPREKSQSRSRTRGTGSTKSAPHSPAAAAAPPPPHPGIVREDSAVINRLVASDPQEDLAREQTRLAESQPIPVGSDITPITGLGLVGNEGVDDGGRGTSAKRQDFSKSDRHRKETKFGDYILGQTLGEGEFGKVKMGWKRDSGIQVAIKLIRRERLGDNPGRLPKIYREIAILRELRHPNIVRLHEMVETERHIGIILEYASGGELFDYILHHRYLRDGAARRLFAQLVSGVGYLHKKGIVHRDLKLENLLLDRNCNIIITDFGFANTFNPADELSTDVEGKLDDKDFIKLSGLDIPGPDSFRRGDLMQTSCGSPCYAAPELVVSDSLYTGRKVDVWSCGVILYAMLAGYLPFDDDPENPEGDNINLLYKYIVSTPLTFPEYITPHAKDLVKRMLVPNPRKRADLFEIARHSWLAEFIHVVGFITSSTSTANDIANASINNDDQYGVPSLVRSASVREPGKSHQQSFGGTTHKPEGTKTSREAKRRTVQLEYVAPQSQTARGTDMPVATGEVIVPTSNATSSRTRARAAESATAAARSDVPAMPTKDHYKAPPSAMPPPQRQGREMPPRSVSDSTVFSPLQPGQGEYPRPSTGGSIGGPGSRLPSRGSYGQPVAATVAPTNAQGRFTQPSGPGAKQYVISGPFQNQTSPSTPQGRASSQYMRETAQPGHPQRHKRSNTLGGLGEKLFGRSNSTKRNTLQRPDRSDRAYPPTSMKEPISTETTPRKSVDSRRSFGFSRKSNDALNKEKRSSRRFSLLPQGMSFRSLVVGTPKEGYGDEREGNAIPPRRSSKPAPQMAFGRGMAQSPSEDTLGSNIPGLYDGTRDQGPRQRTPQHSGQPSSYSPQQMRQTDASGYNLHTTSSAPPTRHEYAATDRSSPRAESAYQTPPPMPASASVPGTSYSQGAPMPGQPRADGLQRDSRRFNDAYEQQGINGASSGAARKVMDFFRRRGKARIGDER